MSSLRALASYHLRSVLTRARGSRNGGYSLQGYSYVMTPTTTHDGFGFSGRKGFSSIDDRRLHGSSTKMDKGINNNIQVSPGVPSSRKSFLPNWAKWTFGAILSLLPSGEEKRKGFLRLEGQMEKVAETAENVAEVVEKVAGVAEIVSAKVADTFPEDSTLADTLKDAALLVEHASQEAAKDAQFTLKLIHKVDELKEEVVKIVVDYPIREIGEKIENHNS